MKFLLPLFLSASLFAAEHTFILHNIDSNQTLIQEGDIDSRLSPYSTFKIALSLIGFDTGLLNSAADPVWPYKKKYKNDADFFLPSWEAPHTPKAWLQNSCVWYSQLLTQKLGMEAMEDYLADLDYGNQDFTGGLTSAWLGSSLRISPIEQLSFLNRLVKCEFPASEHAHTCTKEILFVEELPNGAQLYGKTGGGDFGKGRDTAEWPVSWFIGWIEINQQRTAFVYLIQNPEQESAKEVLKQRIIAL